MSCPSGYDLAPPGRTQPNLNGKCFKPSGVQPTCPPGELVFGDPHTDAVCAKQLQGNDRRVSGPPVCPAGQIATPVGCMLVTTPGATSGPTGTTGPTGGTGTTGSTGTTGGTGTTEPSGVSLSSLLGSIFSLKSTTKAADGTETTLVTPNLYNWFVGAFIGLLSLVVLFATGSLLSVLALWALVGLVVMTLVYYGIIDISEAVEATAQKAAVVPAPKPAGGPLVGSEVFNIAGDEKVGGGFTYEEAPAVCAALDSELATLEQVIEAYNGGAEWCSYGWTQGGMALYPTQKGTWEQLQKEIDLERRTRCGRPGVNGGYMDPMLKLGVNCFGFKPKGEFKPPAPLPGGDPEAFKAMVNKFKDMLKKLTMAPFSRYRWSAGRAIESFIGSSSSYGSQFRQSFVTPHGVIEHMDGGGADPSLVEELEGPGAYSAAPFGLEGAQGPPGPLGPTGGVGLRGQVGPQGPQGSKGDQGERGAESTVPGPTGPLGPTGPSGPTGKNGTDGKNGKDGATGPAGSDVNPARGLMDMLISRGGLKNYTMCANNPTVMNIAKKYPIPGESGTTFNDTRWSLCKEYYTESAWLPATMATDNTLKPEYQVLGVDVGGDISADTGKFKYWIEAGKGTFSDDVITKGKVYADGELYSKTGLRTDGELYSKNGVRTDGGVNAAKSIVTGEVLQSRDGLSSQTGNIVINDVWGKNLSATDLVIGNRIQRRNGFFGQPVNL